MPLEAPGHTGGRSPLTRGSRWQPHDKLDILWSIPAHAGEPKPECPLERSRRVDPRSRGGAAP